MKNFHVYLHPVRGYEAVKEGPSFPALLLNVFWLAFHGLTGPGIVILLGGALLFGAEVTAGRNAVNDVQALAYRILMVAGVLLLWLLPFLHGNQWRHASLLRRGFRHLGRVQGLTPDDAVARMLSAPADEMESGGTRSKTRAPRPKGARGAHPATDSLARESAGV